uniref:Right handed beta helix domain-containing protein n=1 Tax=Tetradesmus obliquus TaxID=3088 RepID=A0A383V8L5_TETOB|eukprot:jgi/Sobl393_1/9318/SZX61511.1
MGCQAELGGAVVAEDSSRLNVHRSTFADNNASYGGVVLARGLSRVSMNECQFEGNTADKRGGVLQAQDSTQVFQNCTLSNSSSETGGAVGAWENTSVAIHDSRIEFSKASDLGGGLYFDGNSSSYLSHLLMVNNSAEASGGSLAVFGSAKQPPGQYNITFKALDFTEVPPAVLSLRVRSCVAGEVAPSPDTCQVCLPGSYSLHPSQQACQPCPPAGADCPGGAAILPLPGWWHSAADSAQMHRCPNAEQQERTPPAELIRCLVLYGQRMLIVASLSIDWPATIAYPLRVLAWVWSSSSPETLSADCVLPASSSFPRAAQRVVFYLSMPAAMLLALLLLEMLLHARRPGTAHKLLPRLGSSAMVVLFFLPSLLRTLFGLFACIPLDQPAAWPYEATAVGSFWVYDTHSACFGTRWHRILAFGLGVPLVALLCVGIPAVTIHVTVSNRTLLDDAGFRRRWGFLTQAYRPKFC